MDIGVAFGTGLLAGFAVAVPLGAIGVLLIEEGIQRGLRGALPAAAAVASVDAAYCATAVFLSALVAPAIALWMPWPTILGGLALVAIAVWGLRRGLAEPPLGDITGLSARNARHRFQLFFGLTLINPATLTYFAAATTGLTELTSDVFSALAFIVGVGLASFGWQALLVTAGALLRRRTSPRIRRATTILGNAIVAALGLLMIVTAGAKFFP